MKKNNEKPLLISITGDIGSGKSAVALYYQRNNYHVFSADKVNHELLDKEEVISDLTQIFGESIITDGEINRVVLRNIVFNDNERLNALNNYLHPKILEKLFSEIESCDDPNKKRTAIFVEVPLLFENRLETKFDMNILVAASDKVKKERIGNRSNIPPVFVDIMLKHQMSQDMKMQKADIVIDNDNNERHLFSQLHVLQQMIEFIARKMG